ncbi:hypothetical protein L207DRAFT_512385 [Hyaloscypha variabilis F]|uniref:Mid2 domain-containing protein n=1 Tax=Hyaloscypha variabilis (strain UAMH 11265 / GT02V1 / F) TaxID=1149755 RepID=A0A2J6RR32_HYAVF|nr:hypothetical protein L207DRAFT_512385 [Hyaloscypha variabilis F]
MRSRILSAWPTWPTILLLISTSAVHASVWTATSYFQLSYSTSVYSFLTYYDAYTFTSTETIESGVTPTAQPISSSSVVISEELTILYVYLPAGSVPESDIVTGFSINTSVEPVTVYVEPIVYTAPASCPTPFTVATVTEVYIPPEVVNQVTPTAYSTSIDAGAGSFTQVTAYLSQGAVPINQTSVTNNFIYSLYIANCENPTATAAVYSSPTGSSGSSDGGGSDDNGSDGLEVCSLLTGCTTMHTWIIVVATILPGIFVLGFVESYFWFRQLMLGKSALRVGTICWMLLSLWLVCFTRHVPERSLEDQAALRIQWNAMSAGTRWKLWWRWGFRRAYPVDLLGPDPTPTLPAQMNSQMRQRQDNTTTGLDVPPTYDPADNSAEKSVPVGQTVERGE